MTEDAYNPFEEDWFPILLEGWGPPTKAVFPDTETVERYRGILPDELLEFWRTTGWGSWGRGKYWLCDPAVVQPVIDTVFKDDPEFDPSHMTGFGYNAYGEIDIWLGDGATMCFDSQTSYVSTKTRPYHERYERYYTDYMVLGYLFSDRFFPGSATFSDEQNKNMFPQALKRLGELDWGEIYSFVPALAMGGNFAVENLQKVPLLENLIFLAQLQLPTLYNYTEPAPGEPGFGSLTPVRQIGRAE
jgi:hypothetical protein